jgi:hypothetical protein
MGVSYDAVRAVPAEELPFYLNDGASRALALRQPRQDRSGALEFSRQSPRGSSRASTAWRSNDRKSRTARLRVTR